MPVGPRPILTPFDPAKKGSWFYADLNAWVMTAFLMTGLTLFLTLVLKELTGIVLIAPLINLADVVRRSWGQGWMLALVASFVLLPSFMLVFVGRVNLFVIGPRRQLRYLCRWF